MCRELIQEVQLGQEVNGKDHAYFSHGLKKDALVSPCELLDPITPLLLLFQIELLFLLLTLLCLLSDLVAESLGGHHFSLVQNCGPPHLFDVSLPFWRLTHWIHLI